MKANRSENNVLVIWKLILGPRNSIRSRPYLGQPMGMVAG